MAKVVLVRLAQRLRSTPAEERTAAMRAAEEHAARAVQALHAKREKGEAMEDVADAGCTSLIPGVNDDQCATICRVGTCPDICYCNGTIPINKKLKSSPRFEAAHGVSRKAKFSTKTKWVQGYYSWAWTKAGFVPSDGTPESNLGVQFSGENNVTAALYAVGAISKPCDPVQKEWCENQMDFYKNSGHSDAQARQAVMKKDVDNCRACLINRFEVAREASGKPAPFAADKDHRGTQFLALGGGGDSPAWQAEDLRGLADPRGPVIKSIRDAGFLGVCFDIEETEGEQELVDAFELAFAALQVAGLDVMVTTSHSAPYSATSDEARIALVESWVNSVNIGILSPQLYTSGSEAAPEFEETTGTLGPVGYEHYAKAKAKFVPTIVSASQIDEVQTFFARKNIRVDGFIQWQPSNQDLQSSVAVQTSGGDDAWDPTGEPSRDPTSDPDAMQREADCVAHGTNCDRTSGQRSLQSERHTVDFKMQRPHAQRLVSPQMNPETNDAIEARDAAIAKRDADRDAAIAKIEKATADDPTSDYAWKANTQSTEAIIAQRDADINARPDDPTKRAEAAVQGGNALKDQLDKEAAKVRQEMQAASAEAAAAAQRTLDDAAKSAVGGLESEASERNSAREETAAQFAVPSPSPGLEHPAATPVPDVPAEPLPAFSSTAERERAEAAQQAAAEEAAESPAAEPAVPATPSTPATQEIGARIPDAPIAPTAPTSPATISPAPADPTKPVIPMVPGAGMPAPGMDQTDQKIDWASGLPVPQPSGAAGHPDSNSSNDATAAQPATPGEKIDWASGLPIPEAVKQKEDKACLSIEVGTSDMWCSTSCAAGSCPPTMCKCGGDARKMGEQAREKAASDWEAEEEKRRQAAEQKKSNPDRKYTDEPWKQSQQSAQAMDNWKEAEARIKSADPNAAYPDGLPPAPKQAKQQQAAEFEENPEDVPMDKSCVSVGPWKSNANDYYCATACAPGSSQPCSETMCKCNHDPTESDNVVATGSTLVGNKVQDAEGHTIGTLHSDAQVTDSSGAVIGRRNLDGSIVRDPSSKLALWGR